MKALRHCLLFLFFFQNVSGQEWYDMINQPKVNYYEVKAKFDRWLAGRDPANVKGAKQFLRWEFMWKNTIDNKGNLPDLEAERRAYASFAYDQNQSIATDTVNWNSLGPFSSLGGYAGIGRVQDIAFHPTNSKIFYALSSGGGLWKTSDGGNNYLPVSDNIYLASGMAAVVAPSRPDVVYVTGLSGKVYKSIDGAKSWQTIAENVFSPNSLSVHPTNENDLVLGYYFGIRRTKNGGAGFNTVLDNNNTRDFNKRIEDIKRNPANPDILYAAGYEGTTLLLYRSVNGGDSWTLVSQIDGGGQRPKLAISPAAPNLVEVATCNASWGMGNIYRSVDTGKTWTKYFTATPSTNFLSYNNPPNNSDGIGWHTFSFTISPSNPAVKFISSINCWKTEDDGKTWAISSNWSWNPNPKKIVHADNHFIGYNPADTGKIYRGNDGGVYVSGDHGATWQDRTNTMAISQVYFAMPPPPTLLASQQYSLYGLQDNGTKRFSNSSRNWQDVQGGDGFTSAIDYGNPGTYYTTIQYGILSSSTLGCVSCKIPGGIPSWAGFSTIFTMNPRRSESLVLAYKDLYRTDDKGNSWAKITNDLLGGETISQVIIAPSDTNVIVARGSYLQRSNDGGKTWTATKITNGFISHVAIHPEDANKMLIINVNSATAPILYSQDGGKNWKNITYNLPTNTYKGAVIVGGTRDDIYLFSLTGVFYKDSTMTAWEPFAGNLTNAIQNDLVVDYNNNQLILATYGRGVWSAALKRNPDFKRGGTAVLKSLAQTCVPEKLEFSYQFNRMYFKNNNVIRVQLSDSSGSFSNPIQLSSITGFNNSGDISVTLPDSLEDNGKYRVRLIATNEADTLLAPFSITVLKSPPASLEVKGGNTIFCSGSSLTLAANKGQLYNYQWYKDGAAIAGATVDSLVVTKGGKYAVRISQGTVCNAITEQVSLTEISAPAKPRISRIGTVTLCSGDSVQLESDAAQGNQWYKGDTLLANQSGKTLLVKEPGDYTVKVTLAGGCSSISEMYSIRFSPKPSIPGLSRSGTVEFCQGDSLILTSSASIGNLWLKDGQPVSGATFSSIKILNGGNYAVLVTNAEGCQSVSSTVSVKVNALPGKPSITFSGLPSCCDGSAVRLTASAAAGFQWYRNGAAIIGATANILDATTSGNYTIVVKNASGCHSDSSGKVTVTVNSNPATPPINWDGSQFSTLAGYSRYRWYKDGVEIAGADTNFLKPTTAGNYKTTVIDQNTCSSISAEYPLVITGLLDIQIAGASITCYPNPARESLFIQAGNIGLKKIHARLFDMHGRMVTDLKLTEGRNLLSTGQLPTGVYQLQLSDGKEKSVIKILITK